MEYERARRRGTIALIVLAVVAVALSVFAWWRVSQPHPSVGTAPAQAVVNAAEEIVRSKSPAGETVLALPADPNGRLVLYVHGASQRAASALADPENATLSAALLREGYAVAAADAHGNAWGSPASVDAYVRLVEDVQAEHDVDTVFVWAESMGGLAGLQLTERVDVAAFAGIYPVCDLSSVSDVDGIRQQVEDAYPDEATLRDALDRLSPPDVDPSVPMLLWASSQDEVVPKADNAGVCATLADDAEVVTTEGGHGDPSNFDPARLVEFFDAHSGQAR